MHLVTFADKSLFLGDDAARVLLEYAAVLAAHDQADTVTLNAISLDDDATVMTFVLNSGSVLMTESVTTTAAEPDNSAEVDYMLGKLKLLENPPNIVGDDPAEVIDFDHPEASA